MRHSKHSRLVDFLEDILESTIVSLENGAVVNCRHRLYRIKSAHFLVDMNNGISFCSAILKEAWANP